jgi:hypothetical protein
LFTSLFAQAANHTPKAHYLGLITFLPFATPIKIKTHAEKNHKPKN